MELLLHVRHFLHYVTRRDKLFGLLINHIIADIHSCVGDDAIVRCANRHDLIVLGFVTRIAALLP